MGLNTRAKRTYLSIFNGKVAIRVEENTPGAVSRVNKLNATVWEKYFSDITGYITSIIIKDGDYGKGLEVSLYDGGEEFVLQFSFAGGYSTSFFKSLPNVDFNKVVMLSPYTKIVDDKSRSTLYVKTAGASPGIYDQCDWYFTKETPNGIPPMVQIKVKGVDTWDSSAQLEFFEALLISDIQPRINQANKQRSYITPEEAEEIHAQVAKAPATPAIATTAAESPIGYIHDPSDDLPF